MMYKILTSFHDVFKWRHQNDDIKLHCFQDPFCKALAGPLLGPPKVLHKSTRLLLDYGNTRN